MAGVHIYTHQHHHRRARPVLRPQYHSTRRRRTKMMMLGETPSSSMAVAAGALWASMVSWFTPAVFFVVINLVIGTIAVTSKSHHHMKINDGHGQDEHQPRPLSRGSSVLTRLRSINLRHYIGAPAATVEVAPVPPPKMVEEEKEEKKEKEEKEECSEFETLEEAYAAVAGARDGNFRRSQSETSTVGAAKEKTSKVVKKSVSTSTTVFAGYAAADREVETRIRPQAPKKSPGRRQLAGAEEEVVVGAGGGGEVDARADDFINRFRKQLQLQRLESILRYKDMLNRGR